MFKFNYYTMTKTYDSILQFKDALPTPPLATGLALPLIDRDMAPPALIFGEEKQDSGRGKQMEGRCNSIF